MATRQAVAAALHRLRFAPVRPQTVGWIANPLADSHATRRLSKVLAYEYWRPDPIFARSLSRVTTPILVLYHGDSTLRNAEHSAISQCNVLLTRLNMQLAGPANTQQGVQGSSPDPLAGAIVLRSTSDELRQDAIELVTPNERSNSPSATFVIVNTGSTAHLPTLFASRLSDDTLEPQARLRLSTFCDGHERVLSDNTTRYLFRVLDDDNRLFKLLLDELSLRGIDPHDPKNAMVILHERDSAFGRALPISLAAALSSPSTTNPESPPQLPKHFFPIAFQSSIDAEPLGSNPISPRSGSSDGAPGAGVQPLGTRQLDHVYRALSEVAETVASNHDQSLSAVFLSSADRSDLRPMIQMIRTRFPGVLILTTDLYAHYADPDDFPVMRNLLVASHLGLSCDAALQGDIPPFRGAYSTSTFLGVLRGITKYAQLAEHREANDLAMTLAPSSDSVGQLSLILTGHVRPSGRVYEITARGAHMLATTNASAGCPDHLLYAEPQVSPFMRFCIAPIGMICLILTIPLSIWLTYRAWALSRGQETQRPSPRSWLPLLGIAVLQITLCFGVVHLFNSSAHPVSPTYAIVLLVSTQACAILTFVAWTHIYREGSIAPPSSNRWRSLVRSGCFTLAGVWFAIALTLLLVGISVDDHGVGNDHTPRPGEHFALMDGASAWSSQFIRIGAISLSIVFIVWRLRDPPTADGRLSNLRGRMSWRHAWRAHTLLNWEPPLTLPPNRLDGQRLDRQLVRRLQPKPRFIRVFIFAIFFTAPFLVLVFWSYQPPTNIRGSWARRVDFAIAALLAASINAAVFLVWDEARVLTRYASNLAHQRRSTAWSHRELTHYRVRHGFNRALLPSLIDVDRLAHLSASTNRTIYWPVALILLASVALHPRFDSWPSSWPSYLLFGISLLFAVYAGLMLRLACEALRDVELEHVSCMMRKFTHAATVTQAEQLLDRIRTLQIGAFAAWRNQPMVRAFAFPVLGFVAMRVINWIGGVISTL
ncbi:MAG: hypothetical protein IT438_10115 [Phycisphaerales bacterium]|nr:hypothetical protein [Phycisphaerales bacterium]